MSLATLKSLLNDYAHVCELIKKEDKWAVRTENDNEEVGSKANLLEEIIIEARRLKAGNGLPRKVINAERARENIPDMGIVNKNPGNSNNNYNKYGGSRKSRKSRKSSGRKTRSASN